MTVKSRLKARKLQVGNTLIVSLSICISFMIVVILNLVPLIYEKLISTVVNNKVISLAVSVVIVFMVYCIYTATRLGVCRFFYKKASQLHTGVKDIFYYFNIKNIFSALFFSLRLSFLKFICFLFCFFPCFLTLALFFKLAENRLSVEIGAFLIFGAIMFALSAVVFYSYLSASLFLGNYYFVSGCYLNFRHLVSCSQNAMDKNKGELLKLRLSFIGWFLSCFFVFPLFYVICYYKQSMAVLAFDFMEK